MKFQRVPLALKLFGRKSICSSHSVATLSHLSPIISNIFLETVWFSFSYLGKTLADNDGHIVNVTWLCWIFWLMSSLGVGGGTAATAASRGENCRGSRLWTSSIVPRMTLNDWRSKIHSISLVLCHSLSLPTHNIWHSHRIIQLSHPHWSLSSNTLHWRDW